MFAPGLDPLHVYLTMASLSVFYLSNQYTLSVIFGRELGEPERARRLGGARRAHGARERAGVARVSLGRRHPPNAAVHNHVHT